MSGREGSTILFVDDDAANRNTFSWLLRSAGYVVREAATGNEALSLVNESPDLVILDVNLPDVDGFEVCRRIKAHPATSAIPVLHMSAVYVRSEDRTHGLEGGADGYLTKPVEPREVLATVHALLRARRAEEERLQLLAERARLAESLRLLLEATNEGIYGLDSAGCCTFVNRAACEMFGYRADELIGQKIHRLIHHHQASGLPYPEEDCPIVAVLQTGQGCRVDDEVLWRRDGTAFPAEYSCQPIRQGDALRGAVVNVLDITDRKRLEEQARQAQKMEAIGRLAGGVAHDFNNLLTIITGNVALMLAEMPATSPHHEVLQIVDKAAWRAAELVRQLLGYSRQTMLWLQTTNLNRCIDEVVGMLRRTIDPRILVEVRTDPQLWSIQADAGQINQVLVNLCLNARDAMPEGGSLVLETANQVVDVAAAGQHPDARPGEFVHLRVRDTGHGIPSDVLPRIFDPYFTTKERGKGTGLGLSMVMGIVQQHGGWIRCTSAPQQGSCFDIYLPHYPSCTATVSERSVS
jgi:two-component system cell cycle sensor histidine kinase/response regulator CckA